MTFLIDKKENRDMCRQPLDSILSRISPEILTDQMRQVNSIDNSIVVHELELAIKCNLDGLL